MLCIETTVETKNSGHASCPTGCGLYIDKRGDIWCVDHKGIVVFIYLPADKSFIAPYNLTGFVEGSRTYGPFHSYTGTLSFSNTSAR